MPCVWTACNVCLKHNIYILADEIYERICFNDEFISVASLSDEIRDITITINGFAKSAALTGTRLGYSATPRELAKNISAIQGHLVSHPCLAAQYIGLERLISSTLYWITPACVSTSTVSPTFLPIRA